MSKRPGQATVEMLFSIIMFVIMTAFIGSLCLYLYVQYNLVTAAREGARIAATTVAFKDGDVNTVQTAVETRVNSILSSSTGQSASSVVITPPTGGVSGQRNVGVSINLTYPNPINLAGLLQAFGVSDTTNLDQIALASSASMRYEE